ncbi:MAG: hypothetical protein ACTSPB_23460, partial [Candidatus Thorarchaeota archaeon]
MAIRGGFVSGDIAIRMTIIGGEDVRRTLQQIGQSGEELKVRFQTVNQTVQQTSSFMSQLGRTIASVNGFIVQASINAFVILLVYRQMASTQRRLQTVQENVAETIRRYGRNSLEARQALRQLEQAQEDARLAQIGFYMQMIFTIGSITTLIARIPIIIAELKALALAFSEVTTSATLANIAMGPLGWALLGLGAGAAITIGGIYLMGGFGGGETEFDRQWS